MTIRLEDRKEVYEMIHHIPGDGWCRITDEDQAKVLYKAIDESETNYRIANPYAEWDGIGHNKFVRKELERHGYYIVRWYKRIDKSAYMNEKGEPINRADEMIFGNHFKFKHEHRGKNLKKFGI
jgi:hypothetical protein